MLTARDTVEDRVRGLREGADDYLVKPFAFSELLARLTALRRRGVRSAGSGTDTGAHLVLGDLQLDLARRKAWRAGQAIALTNQEFQLLALLIRRAGEVLSRTVLAEQVWDMNFDSETTGLLLSSGWRPALLSGGIAVLWWIGVVVVTLSLGLVGWSGCPILEVDVPTADRNKTRTMQVGTLCLILGSAASIFAVLLGPAV